MKMHIWTIIQCVYWGEMMRSHTFLDQTTTKAYRNNWIGLRSLNE